MTENEAIKDIKENVQPSVGGKSLEMAIQALEEIQAYRAIGTVEEFKELKEKNTPKKPFGGMYDWTCPTCGTYHSTHGKCCSECMQVILWD